MLLLTNIGIMNTNLLSGIAISLAVLGLSSCESATRLAKDIQGSWSGAPEKLIENSPSASSYMPVLTFVKTDAANGDITITSTLSISEQTSDTTTISASGQSTISGKWTAADHDEVYINLDPSTLEVTVNPDDVIMTSNPIDGTESTTTGSLQTALTPAIKARMTSAIQSHMLKLVKIDDIKIKNGIMTCEINDRDYSFHAVE